MASGSTTNEFYVACKNGQTDVIDSILATGWVPSEWSLAQACQFGHIDVITRLLKFPMDLHEALLAACRSGHIDILNRLYLEGIDVNKQDVSHGNTALHLVAGESEKYIPSVLQWLLDMGARQIPNHQGETPLHCASTSNSFENYQVLLSTNDNNVNFQDHKGDTPLYYAFCKCSRDIIRLLLDHGAADPLGKCLRHSSINQNRYYSAKILLKEGFPQLPDQHGRTPLHIAVEKNENYFIKQLLKYGGKQTSDNEGNTPLHIAVLRRKDKSTVQLLLNYDRSSTGIRNEAGQTPLFIVCNHSCTKDFTNINMEMIKLLIQANPEACNIPDNEGATPLTIARKANNVQMVKLLLENGSSN